VRRGDVLPVAAIVTTPAKEGLDLGLIAGLDRPIGAPASLDVEAVLGRDDVDVVFYTGVGSTEFIAEALRRCVQAGKDAITFSALAHPPTALGPDRARELDAVARSTGKHILGTGLAPGFLTDVLPVVLASCSVDWTSISARIVAPMDHCGVLTLDAYGIGKPPGDHVSPSSRLSYLESVGIIIDALGVDVASVDETCDPIVSDRRRSGRAKVVEPGMVGGIVHTYRATTSAGRAVAVEVVGVYMLDERLDRLQPECSVEVTGGASAGAKVTLSGGWSPDPYPATAACGLNALPRLLSLQPGLYHAAQVPFAVHPSNSIGARG
jgi:4-hydroxy-tetrahydrodipicolinate reductase